MDEIIKNDDIPMGELKSVESTPLDAMKSVANGDLSNIDTKDIKNQLQAFLLVQAQNALMTNVKLTQTLDMLENKYNEKITQYIADNDDETAVTYLPIMIDTIAKCLERSSSVISNVLDNQEILNLTLIDASEKSISIGNNSETRSALADPVSRAVVRDAVTKMLEYVKNEQQNSQENN